MFFTFLYFRHLYNGKVGNTSAELLQWQEVGEEYLALDIGMLVALSSRPHGPGQSPLPPP